MGLFKEFKGEFSQAINELGPGEEPKKETNEENLVVDTLGEGVDVKSELSKLDGLLEQVKTEQVKTETVKTEPIQEDVKQVQKEEKVQMETTREHNGEAVIVDETSVITASTVLTGNVATAGSFDIKGTINGNVSCNGKLVVTGVINGNSSAAEVFADVAKIDGEIVSTGTVKVGAGSVIIGNITASSAVIAGAVKGDIDVQGPVVIDTSAVIMGNIKSRSVQINNGAIIEGFCSQCYADIDVEGIFNN